MTLEEISIRFTADTAPIAAALQDLTGLLSQAGSQADQLTDVFRLAGAQAAEGLREGLLNRRFGVMEAARALADAAADALRSALSIHSPSRLTFQVGAFFDEGLLRGIAGSAGQVERQAAALGRTAYQAMKVPDLDVPAFSLPTPLAAPVSPSPEAQLPPISLTIPLEIDGYRLGVAAIEGINRVTQGAGRVELTM